jgi:hypothetical protein
MRTLQTATTDPPAGNPLPKPRLILRLGGLGNRKFGTANGIGESSQALEAAAGRACGEVLAEVERILVAIHAGELSVEMHHWPEQPPKWKTHWLALLFGKCDRWEREQLCGTDAAVFSQEKPCLTVLTGGAEGGDAMIRDLALARAAGPEAKMACEHLRIVPEAPDAVADGLGVGANPQRCEDLPAKLNAEGQPVTDPVSRADAEVRARIARQRAYGFRAQSEALRHHSDILLAIWDPDTEGKAGGTSESVAAALQERIPVIAIRLRGPERAEIHVLETMTHLKALQGAASPSGLSEADWKKALEQVLGDILRFPDPPLPEHGEAHGHDKPVAYHPRAAFAIFRADKPLRPIWLARFWAVFEACAKYRVARHAERHCRDPEQRDALQAARAKASQETWKKFRGMFGCPKSLPLPPAPPEGTTFAAVYGRVKDRAASKGMSGVYGDAHRGGIVASYALAALAVCFAVVGTILHFYHASDWMLAATAGLEVLVIFVMLGLATCSATEDWSAAYTESRILAEALRMMEFLGPLGVHTPLPRLPYYLRGDKKTAAPEEMWTMWYFRALVRMAPLRLDGPKLGELEAHRNAVLKVAVMGQQKHHAANTQKQERIHHDIEKASLALFGVVFFCAGLHLADAVLGLHWTAGTSLALCVSGPAFIAAMHGFAAQLEVTRLRQRSASMARLLNERATALEALDITTAPYQAEAVWGLTMEALTTAALLMDETAGWSMLYRNSDIHAG